MCAIELDRLLEVERVEPVEEDAAAGAHRRLAALEWRPRHARARPEMEAADVRLPFAAHAAADGELFANAVVVLRVHAGLHLGHGYARIPDVARVGGRPPCRERREIREGERSCRVPQLV